MGPTVLIDAENVRRSVWPNIAARDLLDRCRAWADRAGARAVVVFDGRAPVHEGVETVGSGDRSADDVIASLAGSEPGPVWVVTSDRELRARVAPEADRILGGGTFARELPDV